MIEAMPGSWSGRSFDVAIVGARVAGSISATFLGEAGYRVLLVDSARFPSDTISTHFFRGAGLAGMLERLGLLDRVLALGCPPLTCEYQFGDDPTPTVVGPQDPGTLGYNLSCRRLALDGMLVERARTSGVAVHERATARELVVDLDGRVSGLVVDHDGRRVNVRTGLVVGADGRASPVARWLDAAVERREPATRALYFRYLRDLRGPDGTWNGPEFSIVGDEMAYVFPSDDDVACLAISVNLQVFERFRRGPESAFEERIARHPGLIARYRASTPISRVLGTGPKDALIRRSSGPGWALVGDAAMHQDPWTGLGMDNAAVHAAFLAEAIDEARSGRASEVDAFGTYRIRCDEHALGGFDYTAATGRDLSRPAEA
jgi:flavin-dependent dehydrogenase